MKIEAEEASEKKARWSRRNVGSGRRWIFRLRWWARIRRARSPFATGIRARSI